MSMTITNEQLDKFIEEEASKIIFEQEGELDATQRDRMDREIDRKEEEIDKEEDKIALLKRKSDEHKRAMGTRNDPIERNIERLQSLKFNNDKKEAEEELKQDKEILADLLSNKRDAESKKTELGTAESGVEGSEVLPESLTKLYEQTMATPILKRKFAQPKEQVTPKHSPVIVPKPKSEKKVIMVKFDKTTNPFTVKFSQRGFSVGGTRLSFEVIENALSKGYTITLNNGFVLDSVKMQKILKYKSRI